MLNRREAITKLNELGSRQEAFTFYCDFLGEQWDVQPDKNNDQPLFHLEISNSHKAKKFDGIRIELIKNPVPFQQYKQAFDQVIYQIGIGNSFLTNLTFKTPIETNLSLEQIFQRTKAKYKLHVPGQFVVFSPETFIQIHKGKIYSYPMKGTIDASIPDAIGVIMNDPKETAEHITIVDLIRNDLSQVADQVSVPKFRYIEEIHTGDKNLLQVSSEIEGVLAADWRQNLGNILSCLLPAGSISGAPKPETIKIIKEVESYDRGFYTGICGHFDGEKLDSGVMIRFIGKEKEQLVYCSGGGITALSKAQDEYQEMIDKIYMPINE